MKFHILNWGMGVESTAIILLWIFFPHTRPFKHWNQLIIITAQTGDEFWETKYLCETFILPLLRKLGVRLVQAAKHGSRKEDGYTLLSDTCEPYEMFIEGDHKLSDNMLTDGWIPRVGRPHICAMRWKGEVLDALIADIITAIQRSLDILSLWVLCQWVYVTRFLLKQPHWNGLFLFVPKARQTVFWYRYLCFISEVRNTIQIGPYLGYNVEEIKRMKDSQDYGCHGAKFLYPLIEQGLTRDDCVELIYWLLGVRWRKSCCRFCPFQKKSVAIAHYQSDPQSTVFALWCEFNALAMNPRMRLFERYGVMDVCKEAELESAIAKFEQWCSESKWSVYYVRRIYRQVGNPAKPRVDSARKVEAIAHGTYEEMVLWLKDLAATKNLSLTCDTHWRVYSHVRNEDEKTYPAIEGFWVVAIDQIRDKCYRKNFDQDWRKLCLQFVDQAV